MVTFEFLLICGAAFFWVFTILIALALVMRLIIIIFPEKKGGVDAEFVAALTAAMQTVFPGTRITKLEEKK